MALTRASETHQPEPCRAVGVETGTERRERATAADRHLESTQHSTPVGRFHAGRGHRVELAEPPVECGGVGLGVEVGAHVGIARRDVQGVDDRPQV